MGKVPKKLKGLKKRSEMDIESSNPVRGS